MSKGYLKREKMKQKLLKKCRYCLTTENLTFDHKNPLSRGGKDVWGNIQSLCAKCNGTKSGLTDREVLSYARWIYFINKSRAEKGKRALGIRKYEERV